MSFQKPKPVLKQILDKLDKMGYWYMNISVAMRSIHTNPRFGGISGIEGGVSMRSKVVILCVTGVLLLLGLNGSANSNPPDLVGKIDSDTVDIAIEDYTAYPGTEKWITVWMKNPVPVAAYRLFFQLLASLDAARFTCDSTGYCFIDTAGCSASALSYTMSCVCEENGSVVNIFGLGNPGEFIPPTPDYSSLFKIRMDICCIPDADTLRETLISLFPGFSSLSDTLGYLIPLRYHMGELFAWWSVPGDANGDSSVNAVDVVFLINYLFIGGSEPCVCEAADCNNDGVINAGDVVYLINYLFADGPAPLRGSVSCWHEDCWP
jgi:hypothetical protein